MPKLIHGLIHEGGVLQLEWHGHNDCHCLALWVFRGQRNVAGLTGNPPIESYIGFTGEALIDTRVITDYKLNARVPANYPFVGTDFNTTRAGIHADGVLKDPEIYSIFDTEKILKRPLDVTISDKSGLAGIACWVNNHLGLEGEDMIDKRHPGVVRINGWVEAQYAKGRVTGISSEEVLANFYLTYLSRIKPER